MQSSAREAAEAMAEDLDTGPMGRQHWLAEAERHLRAFAAAELLAMADAPVWLELDDGDHDIEGIRDTLRARADRLEAGSASGAKPGKSARTRSTGGGNPMTSVAPARIAEARRAAMAREQRNDAETVRAFVRAIGPAFVLYLLDALAEADAALDEITAHTNTAD
jgi:hypothetical protein